MNILLYQCRMWKIGGIESFNLNFCKRLSKYYNITVVVDHAEEAELTELSKYAKCIVFDDQYFETDVCIYASAWGKRPEDHIKAKKYIQMVHADFVQLDKNNLWNFSYEKTPLTSEHWCGGENIAKTFKERYGYDCKVIHYLLDDSVKIQPVLHLISLTRIAKEKGMNRIVDFARILKKSGRKFNWDIWGWAYDQGFENRIRKLLENVPEVSFRGIGRDLASFVADADYLVQLSDTEGYCFSIYEALSYNTPVIATDFPNAREQIVNGENGYIVDMKLDCIDDKFLDKIYTKIPKFKFKEIATEADWVTAIGKPSKKKSEVKIVQPQKIVVQCIKKHFDVKEQKHRKKGDLYKITENRAEKLMKLNFIKII